MKDYSYWAKVNDVEDNSTNVPEAFEVLHRCLTKGMSKSVIDKYGGNIEDLGANQFIKSRGILGQVFNLKQDFLLILTAVSVKDKRIPLNDLFIEFEKEG
ncbi:DNA phosphorothioation-dependent restriction protein DptG [Bacillus sp. N9]